MSGETQKPPCGGFVPGSPRKATTGRYGLIMVGGSGRVNESLSFAPCDARCCLYLGFTTQGLPILNSECEIPRFQVAIRNSEFEVKNRGRPGSQQERPRERRSISRRWFARGLNHDCPGHHRRTVDAAVEWDCSGICKTETEGLPMI